MWFRRKRTVLPKLQILLLVTCAWLGSAGFESASAHTDSQVRNVWVQVVPPYRGLVRAITEGEHCPLAFFDGRPARMKVRAQPNSDFDVLVCELLVPYETDRIEVAGRDLRPVSRNPRRIAVVGDTGCRMKAGSAFDDGFQNCGDPDDWEFAKVAQRVAEWQPDLIIQLGDYIYREQKCPDGCENCQGSPYNSPGMRMATWNVEFFDPGIPMLEAAPIVFVRGDHETCERAGLGYVRFLDPFEFAACSDFSDPYALEFENLQLVVMDTVQADDTSLSPHVVVNRYAQDFERAAKLARGPTWLLSHRPIWAWRPAHSIVPEAKTDACGNQMIPPVAVEDINVTTQDALTASSLSGRLPPAVDLVLTAHIHVGEVLSFTGRRPPQMVVGISGTKLLPAVTRGLEGRVIDGETVTHAMMVSVHGFFGFVPRQRGAWSVNVFDAGGGSVTKCRIDDKNARCRSR
ncbi:metallophosphoesterase [Candidatus Nitrospira allomarina]|nr:metallophosphoesterase [Candidatus Nitrospira allomarina]